MDSHSSKIRVVLIDDHDTVHLEIGDLLASFPDIELIAQGRNGKEAILLCDQHQPDIVLMDISMPVMDGITATKVIIPRHPHTRIIALSGMDATRTVQEMIAAGAAGYVLKDAHPTELASIIRAVYDGKSVFSSDLVGPLFNYALAAPKSPRDYGLTRREVDILRTMGEGLNNSEVASKLSISTATVRFHLTNVIQKLGADSRSEALIIAARQNLI